MKDNRSWHTVQTSQETLRSLFSVFSLCKTNNLTTAQFQFYHLPPTCNHFTPVCVCVIVPSMHQSQPSKAMHVTKKSILDGLFGLIHQWCRHAVCPCACLHINVHVWVFEGLVSYYCVSYSKLHAAFSPPSEPFIQILLPAFLDSITKDSENLRSHSSFTCSV